jgi:predicted glycosyltransferase involved in capsule biosynthesis
VDFIGSPLIYKCLSQLISERDVSNQPGNFFCVPVAFLDEQGTQRYLQGLKKQTTEEKWPINGNTTELGKGILHFVKGSSCIVLNKRQLIEIGGHDESYDGHGAEDFELLHRLGDLYPINDKPMDYSINTGSGPIQAYRGFRAYFALYGEQAFNAGVVMVHLYHPKRKQWGYYQHRRNFAKLRRLMEIA